LFFLRHAEEALGASWNDLLKLLQDCGRWQWTIPLARLKGDVGVI